MSEQKRARPRWRPAGVGVLLALALAGCGQPSANDYNTQGNELYDQTIYGQALPQYKQAALLAPDRIEPLVNLGNTRYQLGDYLGAIEAPKDLLKAADPRIQALIYYNQGNAYYRMNEFQQAIDSYKETLRRTPGDLDAKYNLELAQKQLEQQQQQQQQAGGQGQPPPPQGQQDPRDQQQPGQGGQQPPPQPEENGGGQEQRPNPPPSSLTPEEAERQLDQLRRSEDRRNEDLYDNYAVGGDEGDQQNGTRPSDSGW